MNIATRSVKRASRGAALAVLSVAVGVLVGCSPAGAAKPPTGEALYAYCVSCHGRDGKGNADLAAPAIAGLPQWYVEGQLRKFRTGLRGAHPDDLEGLRMRPMSRTLANDRDVQAVAGYISSLPLAVVPPALSGGNAEAGKASYATCTACHGPEGLGNQQLGSPPIAHQADWYLLSQLQKFKAGHRGAVPGDVTGAQMRPMAMTLPSDQAMRDVVAYVKTLTASPAQ